MSRPGSAVPNDENGSNKNISDELRILTESVKVLKQNDGLSPDFIRHMQLKSICKFKWDPKFCSDAI